MSYSIGLLIGDVPNDDEAVFQRFDSIAETDVVANNRPPIFERIHTVLTQQFPCLCDLPDHEIDNGVWSDGPLINNFMQQHATLGISFSKVEQVVPIVIDVAKRHDVTVVDWQTGIIHRPDDIVLTLEGKTENRNPTENEVIKSLETLTPDGGPSFAVLESRAGYIQTAGGNGQYSVEWRESDENGFAHYVAGSSVQSSHEISIPTNGFQVTVFENECLTLTDVECLFKAFMHGQRRLEEYQWRDISAKFR